MICDNGFYREKLIDPRTGKRSLYDMAAAEPIGVWNHVEPHEQYDQIQHAEYLYYRKRMHDFFFFHDFADMTGKRVLRPYFVPVSDQIATIWAEKHGFQKDFNEAVNGKRAGTRVQIHYFVLPEIKRAIEEEASRTGLTETQVLSNAVMAYLKK